MRCHGNPFSRRGFLTAGTLGGLGISLPQLLWMEKAAAEQAEAEHAKLAAPAQDGRDAGAAPAAPLAGVKRPLLLSAEERSSLTPGGVFGQCGHGSCT